jgi:hypothetical protein
MRDPLQPSIRSAGQIMPNMKTNLSEVSCADKMWMKQTQDRIL